MTGRGRATALLAAVAVTATAVTGCGSRNAALRPLPGVAVTDGRLSLLQQPAATYASISTLVDSAATSVRIAVYALHDTAIEHALILAARRGVSTRVMLNRAYHGQRTNEAAYDALRLGGVDVAWAPPETIAHEKLVVIDDTTAVVSTGNFDTRGYTADRDAAIVTTIPQQVAAIAATMDADYAQARQGRLGDAVWAPGLVWSPAGRTAFVRVIDAARRSLDVSTEEFKDKAVAAAVTRASRRGVACRMILNTEAATTAATATVERAGCAVHTAPAGLFTHEKVVVADGSSLLLGSHNISTTSLTANRELSMQLDASTAPRIIEAIENQFGADYGAGPAYPARHDAPK